MRKHNPTRYSSAVGECWVHAAFKIKYAHNIFDIYEIRNAAKALFIKACKTYNIVWKSIGFDNNHVHAILDIQNYSRPEAAKLLKGYTAKKLFKLFPGIKTRYFWGSGLWSPAYYMDSVGKDIEFMQRYVMKQKYAIDGTAQLKLTSY